MDKFLFYYFFPQFSTRKRNRQGASCKPGELELHSVVAQSSAQGSHSILLPAALHVRRWDTSHTEKGEGKCGNFAKCVVTGRKE